MLKSPSVSWVAAAWAFAAWSGTAIAAESVAPPATTAQNPQLDVAPARRVVRDKDTGKLRPPTPDELQTMLDAERTQRAASGTSTSSGPLLVRQYPSGMRSVVLGPESLVSITATKRPDGTLAVKHDRPQDEHVGQKPNLPTE